MQCPNCLSNTIIDDVDKIVCLNCGLVLNDSPLKTGTECSNHLDLQESNDNHPSIMQTCADYVPPYLRSFPRLHRMTHFPRLRNCLRLIHTICSQLSLPAIIEVQASHMIKTLIAGLSPDEEPPVNASLLEMVSLVFLTVRMNKSVILPLRDISVSRLTFFTIFISLPF